MDIQSLREQIDALDREIVARLNRRPSPSGGPPASNTHVASLARFGRQARYVACDSIAAVFAEVEKETADYGVVPVENSTEGIVSYTLDMFLESELKICAELYVQISHNLLYRCESLDQVTRIYTMPQATAQCRRWLDRHGGEIE